MAIGLVWLHFVVVILLFVLLFFEKYLNLFRRDVMWRERKDGYKMWLYETHGPERGMCISTQLCRSATR